MAIRRYARTPIIGLNFRYGTSYAIPIIRTGIENRTIRYREFVLSEGERLDIIAGKEYGDSTLFWVIAAASNIGWTIQVPPGTRIVVPNIEDIAKVAG